MNSDNLEFKMYFCIVLKRYFRFLKNNLLKTISWITGVGKISVELTDRERDCIILIAETNVPRLERMLYYLSPLRTENFIIISSFDKYRTGYSERIPGITHYLVKHPWQIKSVLKQFKHIKLIHAFESRSIFPYYALKSKPINCPFIFDFQDLYNNYTADKNIASWLKENLYYEKYCIKKADAFISYSLELNPQRRKLNLKKVPSVYFPFFLDDLSIIKPNSNVHGKEVHIVYIGGIAPINWNISFNMTLTEKYIRGSSIFLHVYPSPSVSSTIIEEYKTYQKDHPNLILHESVSNKSMSSEINKYDFAIIPFFKTDQYQSGDKYKYSTSLKLWNFIESGIPIIILKDVEYQSWIVKRLGVGIVLEERNLKDIADILTTVNISKIKNNIRDIQQSYKLSLHINKINSLYDQLLN